MKFLVTGGAGFIGSSIADKLSSSGHEVVIIDNLSTGKIENVPVNRNVMFIKFDITDLAGFSKLMGMRALDNIEGVFHTAACARIQPSIGEPCLTHDTNVTGTLNVLEMMKTVNIDKIVYSASSSFYGLKNSLPLSEDGTPDPLTPYALTKYMGEQSCKVWGKVYGIKNVCLRYFNVYGEKSPLEGIYAPVIGLFFKQALMNNPEGITVIGDGEQRRDFTYVSDIVSANINAMFSLNENNLDINGQTFNIGCGKNYSLNEIADKIMHLCNFDKKTYTKARPAESRETLADITKAKTHLHYSPQVDLDEGLRLIKPYYEKLFKLTKNI